MMPWLTPSAQMDLFETGAKQETSSGSASRQWADLLRPNEDQMKSLISLNCHKFEHVI